MSDSTFIVHGLDQEFLSYIAIQVHSFYFNVTLTIDEEQQSGTNLGFHLKPGGFGKTLHLLNKNNDDVQCMVAVAVYNRSAPFLLGCESQSGSTGTLTLSMEETDHFIIAQTPEIHCQTRSITYSTYFAYLPQLNFHPSNYFEGIKSMMFYNIFEQGYKAKQVYSPFKRYFEKTPGTGIIINSVIIDDNGQPTFFIPAVTYSCPVNTWNSHCSDIDGLRRALSIFLVLYSVVMILNLLLPEFIESILNGMLLGSFATLVFTKSHHISMSRFDVFLTTVFGGFIVAGVFGAISLHFRIGRYLTKFTFSNLVMVVGMEILFTSFTSLYWQFGGAFALSIAFHLIRISFSVFLGGLLLVIGLSNLLKVGNIHRIFINNFHTLTSVYASQTQDDSVWSLVRYNFINYKIQLNLLDFSLIVLFIVGSVLLTIRKEAYFRNHPNLLDSDNFFNGYENIEEFNRSVARNRRRRCIIGIKGSTIQKLKIVSRCRRHHYRSNVIHERSPLISHWLASDESADDEVFESPNSNSRFMRTLSSESKERISKIQNFNH